MHGGLRGGHPDGASGVNPFGALKSPYKAIRATEEDVCVRIICESELGQDELPYPMSEVDAEEYAIEEHQIATPLSDWPKATKSPMKIGEFLVCRSPELIPQINCRQLFVEVTDITPNNLFQV